MSRIFVSYRRDDAPDTVGRMVDRLDARFGPDTVFRDVDDIPYGADFRNRIQEALETTRTMLVVVGPKWLDAADDRGRRLDDPEDPLRVEIAAGLRSGASVIPVLVRGARMPRRSELPGEIQALADINAVELRRDPDFRGDMERLVGAIDAGPLTAPDGVVTPVPLVTAAVVDAPPWWRRGWLAAAFAAVLLIAVLVAALLTRSSEVTVPDVVGQAGGEAVAAIEAEGLTTQLEGKHSLEVPEDLVIATEPSPGAEVERGSLATLFVSLGPVKVPNVVNFGQSRAVDVLSQAGFSVLVELQGSTAVPSGLVIETIPGPGADAAPESTIGMAVSLGPVVPDVSGLRLVDAEAAVSAVADEVVVIKQPSEDVANGTVIRTIPVADTLSFFRVTIYVSTGPPPLPPVPNVQDLGEEEALAALAGYRPEIVGEPSTIREGAAIRTEPEAGTPLALGANIALYLSEGRPTPIVPDVAGLSLDSAVGLLGDAGLVFEVENAESNAVPAEHVLSTEPGAGADVEEGATVLVVVASGGAAANQPPSASSGGPYSGAEGRPITFDATASSDADGEIVGHMWDFGDGTTGAGRMPRHSFAAPGEHTVTVTVEDDDGAVGVEATTVTVAAAPVFVSGAFTVFEDHVADLENSGVGTRDAIGGEGDFWFQRVTSLESYLVPVNGAEMAFVGPAAELPSRTFCESVELAEDAIPVAALVPESYVCLRTAEGMPAGFRVESDVGESSGSLVIRHIVWEP